MSNNRHMFFPSAHAQIYQNIADKHGLDLAQESGIAQEKLDAMLSGKELVDEDSMKRMFSFVIDVAPEGFPPSIYLVNNFELNDLGMVGNVLSLSRDIRQMLSIFIRFQHILMPAIAFSSDKHEFVTSVSLEVRDEFIDYDVFLAEMSLAGFYVIRAHLLNDKVTAEAINFVHASEYDLEHYESFFGCPVLFEAEQNQVFMDNLYLDLPLTTANANLWQLLVEEVIGNTKVQNTISTQVRHMVRGALSKGASITREKVAEALSMSPRTLSRQLQNEEHNFREIYNEEFAKEAKRLLRQQRLPNKAIAQELGFSNTAAFSRAFKSVTGLTPSEFRKQQNT